MLYRIYAEVKRFRSIWYDISMNVKDKQITQKRKAGRPREFDREKALESAMQTFWEHGYEATSIALLRQATDLTSPQLYNAFKDKETLFKLALGRYLDQEAAFASEALQAPVPTRDALARLLERAAEVYTAPGKPRGCLFVTGALATSPAAQTIAEELKVYRKQSEAAIKAHLERGISRGDTPPNTDTAGLAKYFAGVIHGMSIQARDGATTEELTRYARLAMGAWS